MELELQWIFVYCFVPLFRAAAVAAAIVCLFECVCVLSSFIVSLLLFTPPLPLLLLNLCLCNVGQSMSCDSILIPIPRRRTRGGGGGGGGRGGGKGRSRHAHGKRKAERIASHYTKEEEEEDLPPTQRNVTKHDICVPA